MKKIVLYHLIGGQNMPNLIAARHLGAYRHVFFYTKDTKKEMEQLRRLLSPAKCTPVEVEAWDYHQIMRKVSKSIMVEANSDHVLNFTSGNKLMALAADKVFRGKGLRRLYVNSERSEIIEFSGDVQSITPIAVKLSINDYLALRNYRPEPEPPRPEPTELQNRLLLAKHLSTAGNWVDKFRFQLMKYVERPKKWRKTLSENKGVFRFPRPGEENTYDGCVVTYSQKNKSAEITLGGQKFTIRGKDAVHYLAGGFWLEDLFRAEKIEGKGFFDEVRFNVKIKESSAPDGADAADFLELDMVATRNERLYVFELKSGTLRQEAINRAAAVRRLLGKYVKVYIIYRRAPKESKAAAIERKLRELDVHAISYDKFDLKKAKFKENLSL
jgi:hypothetical protein